VATLHRRPIGLLGAPTDSNSSFARGPALAPSAIRAALASDMSNQTTEHGLVIGSSIALADHGDLSLDETPADDDRISAGVTAVLQAGQVPLTLGGDHSITAPIVRAIAALHGPVHILQFDAHHDLYADFQGNPRSHASPFARILERGHAAGITQVGIRTFTRHLQEQVERYGVDVLDMRRLDVAKWVAPRRPIYVSLDLDVLDPAFAPGVSHHEPGGLSVRELISLLHRIDAPIVGADIVELNPNRDVNGMTATVAAKLLKELLGIIARGG
jgi:arginase